MVAARGVRWSAEWGADHSEKYLAAVRFVKRYFVLEVRLVFVNFSFLSVALQRGSAS